MMFQHLKLKLTSLNRYQLFLVASPLLFASFFYSCYIISWNFPTAHGQLATSSSFTLNESDFTVNNWESESNSFNLSGGLTANLNNDPYGAYAGVNFFSGEAVDPLTYTTLTIDKPTIEFNSISPRIFNDKSSELNVTSNNPTGYTLQANQASPLTISDGIQIIPNTKCDTIATCSAQLAAPWLADTSAGFGFNASGLDATEDFISPEYFRPFADQSVGDLPEILAARSQILLANQVFTTRVTYRVNIGGDQQAGRYQNAIFYTVLPNL